MLGTSATPRALRKRLKHLTVESYTVIICQQSYLLLFGIPSPTHSFIPGLKPFFSPNPSYRSLPFLLQDSLHGFPRLLTVTTEHICLYFLVYLFLHFLVVGSVRLIKLTNVGFWAHVKIASRIVLYRIVCNRCYTALCGLQLVRTLVWCVRVNFFCKLNIFMLSLLLFICYMLAPA